MTDTIETIFAQYAEFLQKLDETCAQVLIAHGGNITCRKGCAECCIAISVMPVEFHAIKAALKGKKIRVPGKPATDDACAFLDEEEACLIYELRPVICRTHGYPLFYMDENDAWKLSHCGKNFTNPGNINFNKTNSLNLEGINLLLASFNRKFCALMGIPELDRIPLSDLLNDAAAK
jgi:uncharacterized protein